MADFLPPEAYLPHRAPMLLLDRVINVTADSVICQVSVDPEGVLRPFLTPQGELPAWFGVEIMAQTVGVWSGFHAREQGVTQIRPGMLLGGRGYRAAAATFPAGANLQVMMHLLMRDARLGSFEGEIRHGDRCLASGRLNTWQPDDDELQPLLAQGERHNA
jgi:predicted hotdog family 3-hydroxylacyl-ACP dehydratase